MEKDIKNEDTMQMIMTYGRLIKEVENTSEQMRIGWSGEAGKLMSERADTLIGEMGKTYERLRKWIGSGSL